MVMMNDQICDLLQPVSGNGFLHTHRSNLEKDFGSFERVKIAFTKAVSVMFGQKDISC